MGENIELVRYLTLSLAPVFIIGSIVLIISYIRKKKSANDTDHSQR